MSMQGKGNSKGRPAFKKEKPEFDQQIVDLSRVTRVTKGGKQMSFRACIVIGDRRGRVGYGIEKGKDVQLAVDKALHQAKKNGFRINPETHHKNLYSFQNRLHYKYGNSTQSQMLRHFSKCLMIR